MSHESTSSIAEALDRALSDTTDYRPVWFRQPAPKMTAAARRIAHAFVTGIDIARETPEAAHKFVRGDVLRFSERPMAIYVVVKVEGPRVTARHLSAHGLGQPEFGLVVGIRRVVFSTPTGGMACADLFMSNAERVALFRPGD